MFIKSVSSIKTKDQKIGKAGFCFNDRLFLTQAHKKVLLLFPEMKTLWQREHAWWTETLFDRYHNFLAFKTIVPLK